LITFKSISAEKKPAQLKSRVYYTSSGKDYLPEELAILTYENEGYQAIWAENSYWWYVTALLFWDVIFARVKGAVKVISQGVSINIDPSDVNYEPLFRRSVLETNGMPADMLETPFFHRRRNLFDRKIKELKNSDINEKIEHSYKLHYNNNCRLIEKWDKFSLQQITSPLKSADRNLIIEICLKILSDYQNSRRGLPDLIVFSENEFFFAEVKSKNDKISSAQKSWINFIGNNLKERVDIFLINHTEDQIEKVKKSLNDSSYPIKVSFGDTSSSNKEKALQIMATQNSFRKTNEDGNVFYSASFNTSEILKLFDVLEIIKNWKSLKIEIENKEIDYKSLKNGLFCYKSKIENGANDSWCNKGNYKGKGQHPLKCNKISFWELENSEWENFGHLDTTSGEWIFDKDKIWEKVQNESRKVKLCPLIDMNKIKRVIDKLPEKVNPKTDHNWAFKTYSTWIWYNDQWINENALSPFTSFLEIRGVEKISKARRNQIINSYQQITNPQAFKKIKSQQPGCFIATSVYKDYNSWQVLLFRDFRDNVLLNYFLGRQFIKLYYKLSPHAVIFLDKSKFLKKTTKKILDIFIKLYQKHN